MELLRFYRLLVVLELFTAEFLLVFHLKRRSYFFLRFSACFFVTCGIAAALPLFYNAFYTSFTFFVIFAVTVPMLKFCCDEGWTNIFFCGIAAYTMQHFSYGISNLLMTLIEQGQSPIFGMYYEGVIDFSEFNLHTLFVALVYLLAYFVSYTLLYYLFGRKIKKGETIKIKSISVMIFCAAALVVNILINVIIVYYRDDDNLLTTVMNTVYESLCCIFLLYIQFGLVKTNELNNELILTQALLREKERQYNLSKENIKLINLKCHDLRHQIRQIGEGTGLSKEMVKEIESAISIYDAEVRTENEVLDIILTEKSLKCARNAIALTCVADGHSLDFMEHSDIYSLFGNALDNAIEAVMHLKEEDRNIGVIVKSVGEMVSVNVYNTYTGKIELDGDGLPVTTKSDDGYHGFGVKSICQIAEKYNGICSFKITESLFSLNVLISRNRQNRT